MCVTAGGAAIVAKSSRWSRSIDFVAAMVGYNSKHKQSIDRRGEVILAKLK